MPLTPRQAQIKDEFIRIRKTWAPQWESILRLDCEFLHAYLHLSAVPLQKNHLEDTVKEFIYIAINASSTHLFAPGIKMHLKAARDMGASREELMEVLELTSTVGIHASSVAFPILHDVLNEERMSRERSVDAERYAALKQKFVDRQGNWDNAWEAMLGTDPDLFERYLDFSSVPWRANHLSPKVKELILCAVDASATHLYTPGIKAHMRNAIRHGATAEEIIEVIEIVSVIGIHGALIGGPMLEESFSAEDTESRYPLP